MICAPCAGYALGRGELAVGRHGKAVFLLKTGGCKAEGIEAAIKNNLGNRFIGASEHIGDIVEPQIRNEFADRYAEVLFYGAGKMLSCASREREHTLAPAGEAALRSHTRAESFEPRGSLVGGGGKIRENGG